MEENQKQERKLISGNEVINIISGQHFNSMQHQKYYQSYFNSPTIVLKDLIIQDPVLISQQKVNWNLVIENCDFNQGIQFINVDSSNNITIRSSTIDDIAFSNCLNIHNITILNKCAIDSLTFVKTTIGNLYIQHDVSINTIETESINVGSINIQSLCIINTIVINSSRINQLGIYNRTSINELNIEYSENEVGRISLSGSCRINRFTIISPKHISDIQIRKNTLIKEFIILHVTINSINISDRSYTSNLLLQQTTLKTLSISASGGSIRIWQHTTIENAYFNNATIDNLILYQCNTKVLSLINETKVHILNIEKTITNLLSLEIDNCFIQKLRYNNDKQITASIINTSLAELQLTNTILTKDSYLQLTDLRINNIDTHNTFVAGVLIFNGITPLNNFRGFKKIDANDMYLAFQNDDGSFQFEEYSLKSNIKLVNSDLGKTQLINFNIRQFDKFEYKNSKMLEVFVADTEFPVRQNIFHSDENATLSQTLEQQRLALSQFKKIYENRGDNVRATQALAEEMEVYRLQLQKFPFLFPRWNKPSSWHTIYTKNKKWWQYLITKECWKDIKTKAWWNNRSERINLWLNKVSSFYGNNWLRAATITILIDWTCFLLYCRSLGFRLGNDWDMFRKLWAYSFEFLNPLRKADFLVDKFKHFTPDSTATSIFIDYASRIVIAYFVYQTIAAFRKFGKRTS